MPGVSVYRGPEIYQLDVAKMPRTVEMRPGWMPIHSSSRDGAGQISSSRSRLAFRVS